MSFTPAERSTLYGVANRVALSWEGVLVRAQYEINRALTYDEARELLGLPFITTMNLDDPLAAFVVAQRLTFQPSTRLSATYIE